MSDSVKVDVPTRRTLPSSQAEVARDFRLSFSEPSAGSRGHSPDDFEHSASESLPKHILGAGAAGFLAGVAIQGLTNGGSPSFRNLEDNLSGGLKADWSGGGLGSQTGAKHNALHAFLGAGLYLGGRNRDHSVLGSAAMACLGGVTFELGQATYDGKAADASDAARTCVYGVIGGELLWQANQFGERAFAETGNPLFKALAVVTNPERAVFNVGKDEAGGSKIFVGATLPF